MPAILVMLFLPLWAFAQAVSSVPFDVAGMEVERFVNLGEDTEIVLNDPKEDTVFTLDGVVMDVCPDAIALSEQYFPVDVENIVVCDVNGKEIPYEALPIKAVVRARFVKKDREFVITRVRVLRVPW